MHYFLNLVTEIQSNSTPDSYLALWSQFKVISLFQVLGSFYAIYTYTQKWDNFKKKKKSTSSTKWPLIFGTSLLWVINSQLHICFWWGKLTVRFPIVLLTINWFRQVIPYQWIFFVECYPLPGKNTFVNSTTSWMSPSMYFWLQI